MSKSMEFKYIEVINDASYEMRPLPYYSSSQSDLKNLWDVARTCFYMSDEGQRPRGVDEEKRLHWIFQEGWRLAKAYVEQTHDFSHFPEWLSYISVKRTELLIKNVSDYIEEHKDYDGSFNKILLFLQHTLSMQRDLLDIWQRYDKGL